MRQREVDAVRRAIPFLLVMLLVAGCTGRRAAAPDPGRPLAPALGLPPIADPPEAAPPEIEITGLLGRSDPSTLTMDEVAEGMRQFITDRPQERLKVLYDRWYLRGHPPVVLEADLNGDGTAEIITAPHLGGQNRPINGAGTLIIIYRKDGGWAVDRLPGDEVSGIVIYDVVELTGDRTPEIVWGSAHVGAHTINNEVFVSQWAPGQITTLPGEMAMAYMQLSIEGRDLVLHGGLIGSAGAGPQRARTERYRWTGARFELVDRSYEPGDMPYWRLVDGVTHERFGRLAEAEKAYRDAMAPGWVAPEYVVEPAQAGRLEEAVRATARLRLAALLLGQPGRAPEAAELVAGASGPYADLVRAIGGAKTTGAACAAGAAWANANPAFIEALNGLFGYANKIWTAANLCGLP
ncbi:MAG: hypothetical protein K0R39_2601 [Symbiobacteriaceae bacterium]|jgi:hypothetical protein|nr:hypothetical protein [Symbiobacteriaceae bacterium]